MWPDTIASTSGETLLMMSAQVPESSIVVQSVDGAPFVHEHHDEVGSLGDERGRLGVDGLDDGVDLDVGDAGGADERGKLFGHSADESDLDVAELLDPGGGHRVITGRAHLEVRGDVLPLRAAVGVAHRVVRRHDAVDEVVVALVELVVSDR